MMPRLAFVPSPVAGVEGRSFRSLYPRQLRGLLAGVGMAATATFLCGWGSPLAMAATFLAAVPGFAYGFLRVKGRPVEHWLQVSCRYHLQPQSALPGPKGGRPHA